MSDTKPTAPTVPAHTTDLPPSPGWLVVSDNGNEMALFWIASEASEYLRTHGMARAVVGSVQPSRAIACVNACEGIADPSAIPALVALLREQVAAYECAPMNDLNYAGINWVRSARALLARLEGGKS